MASGQALFNSPLFFVIVNQSKNCIVTTVVMSLRQIERDSVGAIITSSDEQIIMGTKVPGTAGAYAGVIGETNPLWVLPGGIKGEHQSKDEAILSEIIEETGLDLSAHALNLIDELGKGSDEITLSTGERIILTMRFSIYGFSVALPAHEIEIIRGDEMSRMEWVRKTELDSYRLCPPSVPLFQRLGYLPAKQLLVLPGLPSLAATLESFAHPSISPLVESA